MKKYKTQLTPSRRDSGAVWNKVSQGIDESSSIFSPRTFSPFLKGGAMFLGGIFGITLMVFGGMTLSGIRLGHSNGVLDGDTDDPERISELAYADSCESLRAQIDDSSNKGGMDEDGSGWFGNTRDSSSKFFAVSESESVEPSEPGYYTETNVQVEGIDEGDIVKTNGSELFVLDTSENKIKILKIYPFDEAKTISEINFTVTEYDSSLSSETPLQMFLNDDKLVVFSSVYFRSHEPQPMGDDPEGISPEFVWDDWGTNSVTSMTIFDISTPSDPTEIRKIDVEGSLMSTRMRDGFVYLITNTGDPYYYGGGADWDDGEVIPLYRDSQQGSEVQKTCECGEVGVLDPDNVYPSFTTVTALNIENPIAMPKMNNFIGNTSTIYMSNKSIFLVSQKSASYAKEQGEFLGIEWEKDAYTGTVSVVTKLDYSKASVKYAGANEFRGTLLNQFSLDEKDGYLRLAATTGNVWDDSSENYLHIYDEEMNRVATIDDLAKGEEIYSARFYGDIGVIVTFKKIDPLFVFDLSDPEDPKLKGKLKIPGYSDYLHFIDEDTVIGVGKDTVEAEDDLKEQRGTDFAWHQGVKVATFDISDMSDPEELSKVVLGDRGSDSYALSDHKAFVFDTKHNMIILPVLITEVDESVCSADNCYGDEVWQGTRLLKLDAKNRLEDYGGITHFNSRKGVSSYVDKAIQRNIVVDDSVIAISNAYVTITDIESLEEQNRVKI